MAARLCPCGAALEDVGPRCRCPRCHKPARTWLVSSCGAVVAVASEREVLPAAELRDGLRYLLGAAWG